HRSGAAGRRAGGAGTRRPRAAAGPGAAARFRTRPGNAREHAAAGTPSRLCGAVVRTGGDAGDHRRGAQPAQEIPIVTPTPFLTRARLQLLLVAALFLGSFGVAAALFFGGWAPSGTRNFGELLEPYPDLRELPVTRADGSAFAWQPEERRWSIIV